MHRLKNTTQRRGDTESELMHGWVNYLIVWAWETHQNAAQLRGQPVTHRMILLIDELEAHLHPKWQRSILPALLAVGDHLGMQIPVQYFLATHSPLALASVETQFDPAKDVLLSFKLDKNQKIYIKDLAPDNIFLGDEVMEREQ